MENISGENTKFWTGTSQRGIGGWLEKETEESTVSHESGKGWYVLASGQG